VNRAVKQFSYPVAGRSSRRGFTLIEVLVALLVVAIGVLGITALQFKGMQYNVNASFRTQVSVLAYDIAERMRSNPDNAADYAANLTDYVVPAVEPTGCVHAGPLSTGVTNDLECWKLQLFHSLPPGSVANITDNGGDIYTVSIGWFDRENSSSAPINIDYTFRL